MRKFTTGLLISGSIYRYGFAQNIAVIPGKSAVQLTLKLDKPGIDISTPWPHFASAHGTRATTCMDMRIIAVKRFEYIA